MTEAKGFDGLIIGSGPNGLAAAIELARHGLSVLVIEGEATIGGGTRTQEITLPGFKHDICSAIHPLSLASPFLRTLPLQEHGLEWVHPEIPLAHPLENGEAVTIERSLPETASRLGADSRAYLRMMAPMVDRWEDLMEDFLGPFPIPPRHPWLMARFGRHGIRSARGLAAGTFKGARAQAAFAGMAAHSIMPLERPGTAAFGLMLATLAHAVGWPMAKGGSQAIAGALASHLVRLGGEITTERTVTSFEQLPPSR
ncbi:MAG: phytoene desaturase family protein, partial [Anaerolineales bacterium]